MCACVWQECGWACVHVCVYSQVEQEGCVAGALPSPTQGRQALVSNLQTSLFLGSLDSGHAQLFRLCVKQGANLYLLEEGQRCHRGQCWPCPSSWIWRT